MCSYHTRTVIISPNGTDTHALGKENAAMNNINPANIDDYDESIPIDFIDNSLPDTTLCSGFGAYHTDQATSPEPKPYKTTTLNDVLRMVEHPPSVAKENAKWVIFSTVLTREAKKQREHGLFYAAWCDLDNHTELTAIKSILAKLCVLYIVYSSRSSKLDHQKWRVIVPLSTPATATEWQQIAEIINDKFEQAGIVPDRASERVNQICYLPNKGEFYQFHIERNHQPLDWKTALAAELSDKQHQAEHRQAVLNENRERSRQRAIERMQTGETSPINAYKAEYPLEQSFDVYSYKRVGHKWLSPNSESGNPGVTIKGDKWISKHSSDSKIGNPCTGGEGTWGDSFDLFVWYEHQDDRNAATKAAGDMFTVKGKTITKNNQQSFMQEKAKTAQQASPINAKTSTRPVLLAQQDIPTDYSTMPTYNELPPIGEQNPRPNDGLNMSNGRAKTAETFVFDKYSFNNNINEMREKMMTDVFVLRGIALRGQVTAIYARHGTGKTLLTIHLLRESAKQGNLEGMDVFYINADDDYNGMIIKAELMQSFNVRSVTPGINGFSEKTLTKDLDAMTRNGTAKATVLILDTMKKFTNVMNKELGSAFMQTVRRFVQSGGTVIMLGHTNKHKGLDGKPVAGGVSDIPDDADCVYMLDVTSTENGVKSVLFDSEYGKTRGANERTAGFSYIDTEKVTWVDRLNSIKKLSKEDTEAAERVKWEREQQEKDSEAIEAIVSTINESVTGRTELIKAAANRQAMGQRVITKVLDKYRGKLWRENKVTEGKATVLHYILLCTERPVTEKDYRYASRGE